MDDREKLVRQGLKPHGCKTCDWREFCGTEDCVNAFEEMVERSKTVSNALEEACKYIGAVGFVPPGYPMFPNIDDGKIGVLEWGTTQRELMWKEYFLKKGEG